MSTKHVRTPGDLLRFRCWLRIDCRECHASRTLSPVEVLYITPASRTLDGLERRMICSRCKRRAAKLTVLMPL